MEEFLKFIAGVMKVDSAELSAETAYGEHEKWDSLMHMSLVMETEERYDVEIPIEEIPKIRTLSDLYRYVQNRDS